MEKTNQGAVKKFNGKCYHCGKKGHRKSECWALKKEKEQANVIGESNNHEDEEEYAFMNVCNQISDIGIETSYDLLDKDIINRQTWVSGETKDILNYEDDYLKANTNS